MFLARSHRQQLEAPKPNGWQPLSSFLQTHLCTDFLNGNLPSQPIVICWYCLSYGDAMTQISTQTLFLNVEGNLSISSGFSDSQWSKVRRISSLHLDLRCLEFLWGPLTFLYTQEKLNLGYFHTLLLFFYWLSKIYLQPKRKTAVVFTVIHGHLHVASTWTTQHTHTFIPRVSQIYCMLFLLNSSISLKLVLHGVYSS